MSKINAWVWVGVVGLVGCGGSSVDGGGTDTSGGQSHAVERAAEANCDNYEACGDIGAGKGYSTREECVTQRSAYWSDRWPATSCDKRINANQLSVCLGALQTISCNSLTDELKVNNEKCPQASICAGN
ncbi:DUF6184 family natural product biosynthesis lipoprotein [Melittangium boletus]|uniref:Lipoprotein n=1 Tax=Melittangium boletus DSM 14713 TaxID=1294270 RepID=A0A250IG84_9BACT|nr:DUF6184 family natural product biosynthesis lipoprotein [Melittangium boletus]ATB29946.1 hypothetical protein MEBOL_003401 [Melittangium boletus DSM 14713]